MSVITNKDSINKINSSYRQIYARPVFGLARVSQAEIAREVQDGRIGNDLVKICHFLHLVEFATAKQISKYLGKEITSKMLNYYYTNLFINKFVLSDINDDEAYKEKDALNIYTLDFGGQYLLSIKDEDMTNWTYTNLLVSATLVAKALKMTNLVIGFSKAGNLTLRSFQPFRDFRIGKELVSIDFATSLLNQKTNEPVNFIGYFVDPGEEDLHFRDNLDILDQIFNQTQNWKRYYPLANEQPKLLLVIDEITNKREYLNTIKVVANTSHFADDQLLIIGNDQLNFGLDKCQIFTFTKNDKGEIVSQSTSNELFKL